MISRSTKPMAYHNSKQVSVSLGLNQYSVVIKVHSLSELYVCKLYSHLLRCVKGDKVTGIVFELLAKGKKMFIIETCL